MKYIYIYIIYFIVSNYDLPRTKKECQQKLKEEFKRNAHISDLRVIDLLLIKVKKMYSFYLIMQYT